jgi:hypothetical protein
MKLGSICCAAALAPALIIGSVAPSYSKNTGAVIGGLIAGAAIGAMVSGAVAHPQPIYYPPPAPPPPPRPWGSFFEPAKNVRCYPAMQACYKKNGAYAANWTWKMYAR